MGKAKKYVLLLQKSHHEDGSNAVLMVGHARTDDVTHKDIVEDFVSVFHKYYEDRVGDYIPMCCLRSKEAHDTAKFCFNCGRRLVVCIDEITANYFMKIFDGKLDDFDYELNEYLLEEGFAIAPDMNEFKGAEFIQVQDIDYMFEEFKHREQYYYQFS